MEFSSAQIMSFLTDKVIPWGLNILGVIVLVIIGLYIARVVSKITLKALLKARLDETISKALAQIVRWVVILVVVIGCLGIFGIETTSFAAVLGAAGLAIGLAFQGALGNFAAGVMILVFRPFVIGSVVTVNGETGKVIEIKPFETILDTPDNRRIIMPNSKIYGNTIMNINHHDERRVDVHVGIDYAEDIEKVRAALEEATHVEGVIDHGRSAVVMQNFGESSIDWELRVWVRSGDYFDVRERLVVNIKKTLDKHGVSIPFPHIRLVQS